MFIGSGVVRLGQTPDLKFMPNGQPVVTFSAVIDQFKKQNGDEVVTWGRFKAFGETAKTLHNYLKSGHLLQILEASLRTQKFNTREGTSVETFDFIIKSFKFLPNKKKEDDGTVESGAVKTEEQEIPPVESSDDIPF